MKKLFLLGFIASAALAMTSCSSDEVTENGGVKAQAVEFGTYVGRDAQTRSANAITNNEALQAQGFGVFAFYTEKENFEAGTVTTPNFMNNQKVEYSADNAWTYSPLKYWPNNDGDKVSFFAYAPYDAAKTWDTGNKIAYTVANDVTKQVDLLFAPGKTNLRKQSTTKKITFAFKHALARIGFSVAYAADQTAEGGTLDANTTITINKVVLRNMDAATETEGVFYQKGNLIPTGDNVDDAWADKVGTQAFTLLPANFTENVLSNETAKIAKLNNDDSYVMIIPQATDFEVYVEYTVTTTDNSLDGGKSEIVNKIATPVTGLDFKANSSYALNLVLGMTSVKVDAEYNDWSSSADTEVKVPANN